MGLITSGRSSPRVAPPKHYVVEDLAPEHLVATLAQDYPELAVVPGLLRLVVHVLRAPDRDGEIVYLPAKFLATIIGEEKLADQKKVVTKMAIGALRSALSSANPHKPKGEVLTVPADYRKGMATGFRIELPSVVSVAARSSRDVPSDDRITITNWCRVLANGTWTGLEDTSSIRKEMIRSLPPPDNAPELSRDLQDYLNGHSPKVYQDLRKHIQLQSTGQFVRQQFPADVKRYGVVAALRDVLRQPVPIYSTSERTARLSAIGRNATSLPAPMRHHLTKGLGWMEMDLAHAQLACNAEAWSVGPVLEQLAKPGYRFWDDLLRHIGVDPDRLEDTKGEAVYSLVKKTVKRPVHGLSFGMNVRNIKRLGLLTYDRKRKRWYRTTDWDDVEHILSLVEGPSVKEAGERLVTHPLVAAMLRARTAENEKVSIQGGRYDRLGVFHKLVPAVDESGVERRAVEPRHVLARVTQAHELYLLRGVIRDAISETKKTAQSGKPSRPNYRIMLWQHDGFTVSARGGTEERLKQVGRKLRKLVAKSAEAMGVPTELGVDVGPDLN